MTSSAETQVCSLPLPPTQYISCYSEENIRQKRTPKPPPIPGNESYSMFGNPYNNEEMIRSLESQGIKRLLPQHFDRRMELKKLNHSLFVNFLDLIDFLVNFPDSPRRIEKIDDLGLLFVHMHHLLNEFRPHQARETLRVMMEMQKRQRVETTVRFQKHLEFVKNSVKNAFANLPSQSDNDKFDMMDIDEDQFDSNTGDQQSKQDQCEPLDRLMCQIVDQIHRK